MKQVLYPLILVLVCFLIDIRFGLVASLIFSVYAFFTLLPNLYALKGNKHYSQGNVPSALKYYKKAIKTGRASDKITLYYALMLLRNGYPEDAERIFDSLLLKRSTKPEDKLSAKQFRTMAYCKQGRMKEALEDARELFEDARNTTTYSLVGYFLHLTDAPLSELMSVCKEAYEYNPEERDIADNYLLALIKSGDLSLAKEVGNKLTEKNPTFIEGYYHMAMCEKLLGNKKAAFELLAHIPDCRRTYLTTVSEAEIEALSREVSENA